MIVLAALLTSCAESYPSIVDESVKARPDEVIPLEKEADLSPIMPTLSAPQFGFVTRGDGPLEAWDVSGRDAAETERVQKQWRDADFRVFAFQTQNINLFSHAIQGGVDMSQTDDKQYLGKDGAMDASSRCLLFNRVMHVTDPYLGRVRFEGDSRLASESGRPDDVTFYYRMTGQDLKYNFFTYYADDAVSNPDQASTYKRGYYVDEQGNQRQQLSCRVNIDGTQDLMHSFAYHTREQYQDRIDNFLKENLPKDQLNILTSKDAQNPLISSYNQILYSTATGHRSINPIFSLKHLLSRFNVSIKGQNTNSGSADEDFRNIVITQVIFRSPSGGEFIIAKDSWGDAVEDGHDIGESYLRDLEAGQIIQWDDVEDRKLKVGKGVPLRAEIFTDKDDPESAAFYAQIPKTDASGTAQRFWAEQTPFHVTKDTPVLLAKSIMLPPLESLSIELKGYFLKFTTTEDGQRRLHPTQPIIDYSVPATLRIAAEPQVFEPGKEYNITVYVYGLQHITVTVELGHWVEGNDGNPIEVNKDGEDENV